MSSKCSCLVERVTDVSSATRTVHLGTIRVPFFQTRTVAAGVHGRGGPELEVLAGQV